MTLEALLTRVPRKLAFWALAAVGLLVSHDLVYLVQTGPGESLARALRHAGHEYWGVASLALVLVGLAVAAGAWIRLRGLRRRAAALGARAHVAGRTGFLGTWLRLFLLIAAGFLVQENLEHAMSHGHVPGIGALVGTEYPLALPLIVLISGLSAFVAASVGGIERELVAVIAAALRLALRHRPLSMPRPPLRLAVARISPLARSGADRAPPRSLPHHS